MAIWILLAFVGVPLIEIALFIEVGGFIGLWPTIAIVIATAVVGTALIRHQGLSTLRRAQQEMDANRLPMRELFDGVCLLFAGALLLTPGFMTDTLGFLLLVPPLRRFLGTHAWRGLQNAKGVHFEMAGGRSFRRDEGPIVDADAVEIKGELENGPPKQR